MNVVGSHSGIHKLNAVYVTIPTFPPKYASFLQNIFLVLLFHINDRKQFGNNAISKSLPDELKFLEENGVTFYTEQYGLVEIRFIVTLILGDNLSLHSVLGFTESCSAQFNCRFCKINKFQYHAQTTEDNLLIQTHHNYTQDLLLDDMSKTGVKEDCIFNSKKLSRY